MTLARRRYLGCASLTLQTPADESNLRLDNLGAADNYQDNEVRDKLAPIRRGTQDTAPCRLAPQVPP